MSTPGRHSDSSDHAGRSGTGSRLDSLASLGTERGWRDELLWQLTERIRTQRLQQQLRRARSGTSG